MLSINKVLLSSLVGKIEKQNRNVQNSGQSNVSYVPVIVKYLVLYRLPSQVSCISLNCNTEERKLISPENVSRYTDVTRIGCFIRQNN